MRCGRSAELQQQQRHHRTADVARCDS